MTVAAVGRRIGISIAVLVCTAAWWLAHDAPVETPEPHVAVAAEGPAVAPRVPRRRLESVRVGTDPGTQPAPTSPPVTHPLIRCVSPHGRPVPLERVRAIPVGPVEDVARRFHDLETWHRPNGSSECRLSRRPSGAYRLEIVARQPWVVDTCVVELVEGRPTVDVVSVSGLTLSGVVRDQHGAGVSDARVCVEAGNATRTTTTEVDGGFRIEGLDAGPVRLSVFTDDWRFPRVDRELELATDEAVLVPVEARPTAVIPFDPATVDPGEIRVVVRSRLGARESQVLTDRRGSTLRFLVPVAGTRFDLWVRLGRDVPPVVRRGLIVPAAPSFQLDPIVPGPVAPLRVRMVDEEGRPLRGMWVSLADQPDAEACLQEVDADGWCEFATPPALPLRVRVRSVDHAEAAYLVERSPAVIVPERGSDIDVDIRYEPKRHRDGVGMYFVPLNPDQVATPVWWYGKPGTFRVRLLPGRYEVRRAPGWDMFKHSMAHPQYGVATPPLAEFEVPVTETVTVRIE